jgi:hypothetical protein
VAYTQAGLPDGGNTPRFEIHYDDSLSTARGRDLAAELMHHCDADYAWLKAFFPTAVVGPPGSRIRVYIKDADPSLFLSAEWIGYGLIPFDVTVNFGGSPVTGGMRPVDAVRWLIVLEVSEMLMRERQGWGAWNDWFAFANEGSKGESLSQIFGAAFIRARLPAVTALPRPAFSSAWLTGSGRPDFVSKNVDTILPGDETGCGIQFLSFLHDQLGFPLEQVIAAGARTLADVYHNLTGDARSNAYPTFVDLLNLHYPALDGAYDPALECAFPVATLDSAEADPKVTWVPNGRQTRLRLGFDRPPVAETTVRLSSDAPGVVGVPSKVTLNPRSMSVLAANRPGVLIDAAKLSVQAQGAGFTQQDVTLTARYAGKTATVTVRVVPPDAFLPALAITATGDGDRCRRLFLEGTGVTLSVANLNVFADPTTLTFRWVVTGAVTHSTDTREVSIASLPSAGSSVKVEVTVENPAGLRAKGELIFETVAASDGPAELDRHVRCKISSMPAINVNLPPWIPIMTGPLSLEHVVVVRQVVRTQVEALAAADDLLAQLELTWTNAAARRQ